MAGGITGWLDEGFALAEGAQAESFGTDAELSTARRTSVAADA